MIRLNAVNKYFFKDEPREVHALNDIDLTIEDGEFSLFSGPSGCGKTTLLNAIGALDSVDSGEIYLDDKEITTLSEEERTPKRIKARAPDFRRIILFPF